jgi:hypothetical protein
VAIPSQESGRSCICLLSPLLTEVAIPSQESGRSCICLLSPEVAIPSQESGRSCICLLSPLIVSLSAILMFDFGIVLIV